MGTWLSSYNEEWRMKNSLKSWPAFKLWKNRRRKPWSAWWTSSWRSSRRSSPASPLRAARVTARCSNPWNEPCMKPRCALMTRRGFQRVPRCAAIASNSNKLSLLRAFSRTTMSPQLFIKKWGINIALGTFLPSLQRIIRIKRIYACVVSMQRLVYRTRSNSFNS